MRLNARQRAQVEEFLSTVLDSQDGDVVVVRKKDCKALFMNESARARLPASNVDNCKLGYGTAFPGLCDKCGVAEGKGFPQRYDIKDENERIFEVFANEIAWLDGKDATLMFLRDVHEAREAEQKLYALAYVDQLTQVPNRQKFKDDFEELATRISGGELSGVVGIFDLDNFKAVNDTYGHNTGDVMLRRLTEHLDDESRYKGHIYRLGGDEFVLFYADIADKFATPQDIKNYYAEMFKDAFVCYTLPNIELSCTLSMGVALFPEHGIASSELLRKADIALYMAKENGRDQLRFFEDQYDNAKKFKDLYINIQPILTSAAKTFGYELIDQGQEECPEESELNLTEFDRTLDALGLDDIENNARYFISYSKQLMNPSVLHNLPKDKFVVQIALPDRVLEEDLARYRTLRENGYSLALAGLTGAKVSEALLEVADYCKIRPGVMNDYTVKRLIGEYPKKIFIAENVDSQKDLDEAKRKGFKLFQGFFFSQPVVKKTKEIDPMKMNYFRLLKLTSTDDYVDFREVSAIIAADVALTYKLLRLLNSAAMGLRYKISSVDMAVAYLGEENLKKWIGMLALRGVAADQPVELLRMSLIRAQFGELLAPHFMPRRNPKHVFLMGMLSLLHIAMDRPREELMEEISVAEDISDSLLNADGIYSDMLSFFSNYEYGNWDDVSRYGEEHGLSSQLISDCYLEAVNWYNGLAKS